jgi:predicted permease
MPAPWRRAFRLPRTARTVEREVDEEIAFHIAMREAALRDAGLSGDDAHLRARQRFGPVGPVRAECVEIDRGLARRERVHDFAEECMQDLSFALRGLRRAPGFAAAAVLTLALGIGAATAIFTVVYSVLLRPLPFRDAERLVAVASAFPAAGLPQSSISAPEFLDIAAAGGAFSDLGAYDDEGYTLAGTGRPERVRGAAASASLFRTLGVRAAAGRLFGPDDDRPGADRVVVLGDALWRRRFGGDPGVVGSAVRVDGVARTVVGVLPRDVRLGDAELIVPLALDPARLPSRGAHYLEVVGRLAPGATLERAQAQLAAFAARSRADYPALYRDQAFAVTAIPLREAWFGDVRPTMLVLLGAVALLLLLAAVNVANLLLVRAEARQREIAVRLALGAGRGRLVRQLLTETLLLAAIGGAVGLPLAALGVRALLALNPGTLPAGTELSVDAVVLLVAVAVGVGAAVLAGLAPAVQASSPDVRAAIVEGTAGGARGGRLRSALVALEITAATVVLVGAGLVGRSFWRLQGVNPGFAAEGVLTMDLTLTGARYEAPNAAPIFYQRLLERLGALPGVRSAAAVSHLPLGGRTGDWVIEVEGRAAAPGEAIPSPNFRIVAGDYFRTVGVPIMAGRGFEAGDTERTAPVAVVSEALARVAWPGESPLGKRFRLGGGGEVTFAWMRVVGVAGDVRGESLGSAARPTYYMLGSQFAPIVGGSDPTMTVVVRTAGDPRALTGAAREAVWALDPEVAVPGVRTLAEVVSGAVSRPRFATVVLLAFGGAALLLAVTGVYGVLSYAVARRARELAIRMALGARAGSVRRLVLASGLRLAAAGVAVGVACAAAGSRLLASLLYDVSATDPATFAAVVVLLLGAAFGASYVPALRATRADPAAALRAP